MLVRGEGSAPAVPSVLLIHLRWSVADAEAAPLNEEMLTRLAAYLPRYADTLSARCLAVGGVNDHLHLLLDLPVTKSLQEVTEELRGASQRFVREVFGSRQFLWNPAETYCSISPSEQDAVTAYIQTQKERHGASELWDALEASSSQPSPQTGDAVTIPNADVALPEWLRAALNKPSK